MHSFQVVEVNCDELKTKKLMFLPIKETSTGTDEDIRGNIDTFTFSQEHNRTEVRQELKATSALSNGETAHKENPPPELHESFQPQLESLVSTIIEEEEPKIRHKQSEKPVKSSKMIRQGRPQPTPTKPGAISCLALSRITSGERSPLSVAAPRRSQSFALGLEATPGSGFLVNSVAGSVHKHRQQFLQRRSMFEAPAAAITRLNSRPFEIELRALKLGTRTLDGDLRPAVNISKRQSWSMQQTISDNDQHAPTEKQSAAS
ncbi:hypothetical protein B566_EDAN013767 [Ephemera danica]|nr:hypothetical protein B566_EDAN013767 [Ephemera danica]